jgi:hypothetical protein
VTTFDGVNVIVVGYGGTIYISSNSGIQEYCFSKSRYPTDFSIF